MRGPFSAPITPLGGPFCTPVHTPDQREHITIDGEPTSERDYSSFVPRALYHQVGSEPPADPYEAPALREALEKAGVEWRPRGRKIVKDIFNMLVNADISQRLHGAKPARALPDSIPFTWAKNEILKHNEQIRSLMFTGAGLDLMKRESDLGLDLMRSAQQAGIPVLPIHDGFRVKEQDIGWLESEMRRLYQAHFGHEAQIG